VGSVRFPETLLPLIDESLAQGARLDLYGGGPDLHRLQRHSHGRGEILFHGAYSYNDLPRIYREIDLLWAAYPENDVNVRYAISNKYFESLWFGVPAVFAQGTMLGAMIAREGTGFEVNATDRRAVGALLHRIRSEATLYGETRERLLEKRERIVGDLSWDSQQYRFVELLEEVCRC
jgi:glycosyltransferase involved in cell wall biosynthesis